MNIEGTYTVQAPAKHVWHSLMDPQVLLYTVPGIEKLEKLDATTYEVTMQMKHAPLKGAYRGHITISEQQFPHRYCIEIQGEGRQNTFSGSGSVRLDEQNNNTVIAYHGELKQDKRSTLLPPAVVRGAAKLLIQQFFSALAVQLGTHPSISSVNTETPAVGPTIQQPGGTITILPPELPSLHPTLLQTLIEWSGLVEGDAQVVAWETRIRRIGLIAGLLFLVWIGTRLPRKR